MTDEIINYPSSLLCQCKKLLSMERYKNNKLYQRTFYNFDGCECNLFRGTSYNFSKKNLSAHLRNIFGEFVLWTCHHRHSGGVISTDINDTPRKYYINPSVLNSDNWLFINWDNYEEISIYRWFKNEHNNARQPNDQLEDIFSSSMKNIDVINFENLELLHISSNHIIEMNSILFKLSDIDSASAFFKNCFDKICDTVVSISIMASNIHLHFDPAIKLSRHLQTDLIEKKIDELLTSLLFGNSSVQTYHRTLKLSGIIPECIVIWFQKNILKFSSKYEIFILQDCLPSSVYRLLANTGINLHRIIITQQLVYNNLFCSSNYLKNNTQDNNTLPILSISVSKKIITQDHFNIQSQNRPQTSRLINSKQRLCENIILDSNGNMSAIIDLLQFHNKENFINKLGYTYDKVNFYFTTGIGGCNYSDQDFLNFTKIINFEHFISIDNIHLSSYLLKQLQCELINYFCNIDNIYGAAKSFNPANFIKMCSNILHYQHVLIKMTCIKIFDMKVFLNWILLKIKTISNTDPSEYECIHIMSSVFFHILSVLTSRDTLLIFHCVQDHEILETIEHLLIKFKQFILYVNDDYLTKYDQFLLSVNQKTSLSVFFKYTKEYFNKLAKFYKKIERNNNNELIINNRYMILSESKDSVCKIFKKLTTKKKNQQGKLFVSFQSCCNTIQIYPDFLNNFYGDIEDSIMAYGAHKTDEFQINIPSNDVVQWLKSLSKTSIDSYNDEESNSSFKALPLLTNADGINLKIHIDDIFYIHDFSIVNSSLDEKIYSKTIETEIKTNGGGFKRKFENFTNRDYSTEINGYIYEKRDIKICSKNICEALNKLNCLQFYMQIFDERLLLTILQILIQILLSKKKITLKRIIFMCDDNIDNNLLIASEIQHCIFHIQQLTKSMGIFFYISYKPFTLNSITLNHKLLNCEDPPIKITRRHEHFVRQNLIIKYLEYHEDGLMNIRCTENCALKTEI